MINSKALAAEFVQAEYISVVVGSQKKYATNDYVTKIHSHLNF